MTTLIIPFFLAVSVGAPSYDVHNPNPTELDIHNAQQAQREYEQKASEHANNGNWQGVSEASSRAMQAERDALFLQNQMERNEREKRHKEEEDLARRERESRPAYFAPESNRIDPDPNFNPMAENAALRNRLETRKKLRDLGERKFTELYTKERRRMLEEQYKRENPKHPRRVSIKQLQLIRSDAWKAWHSLQESSAYRSANR